MITLVNQHDVSVFMCFPRTTGGLEALGGRYKADTGLSKVLLASLSSWCVVTGIH